MFEQAELDASSVGGLLGSASSTVRTSNFGKVVNVFPIVCKLNATGFVSGKDPIFDDADGWVAARSPQFCGAAIAPNNLANADGGIPMR